MITPSVAFYPAAKKAKFEIGPHTITVNTTAKRMQTFIKKAQIRVDVGLEIKRKSIIYGDHFVIVTNSTIIPTIIINNIAELITLIQKVKKVDALIRKINILFFGTTIKCGSYSDGAFIRDGYRGRAQLLIIRHKGNFNYKP